MPVDEGGWTGKYAERAIKQAVGLPILFCKMRYILRNNAISVFPACPESFSPQETDSGQAGMTLGLHFSINIRCQQQLIANVKGYYLHNATMPAGFLTARSAQKRSCRCGRETIPVCLLTRSMHEYPHPIMQLCQIGVLQGTG